MECMEDSFKFNWKSKMLLKARKKKVINISKNYLIFLFPKLGLVAKKERNSFLNLFKTG